MVFGRFTTAALLEIGRYPDTLAGETTLSHETPANMIGRVSAVYLLVQTLAGQTLGPLAVAITSERLFSGPGSIASGLAVVEASCAAVAALCGLVLARHLRARAGSPAEATGGLFR